MLFTTAQAIVASLFLVSQSVQLVGALDNGLGLTPAMGWNSWNLFACDISEEIVKGMADTIVRLGLDKLGYRYINIDDCWQIDRDEKGFIIVDKVTFPSGMKALGDYIHSKGLLFGTYSSAGTYTCQGRPGSLNYETQDAISYASWGVDYLKLDNCYNEGLSSKEGTIYRYGRMRDALNATGRPMLYSLCNWGEARSWEYADDLGNSWRTTGDICDSFEERECSAMKILDQNARIMNYSHPGGFNDLDMLEVGNGGMTKSEYRAHFSIWSALKSPLLLGNDLRSMTKDTVDIITNEEVIAINQDSLGVSAKRVMRTDDGLEIWAGPLANGDKILVALNRGSEKVDGFLLGMNLIFGSKGGKFLKQSVKARDLWKKTDTYMYAKALQIGEINAHDVVMLRISKAPTPWYHQFADGADSITTFQAFILLFIFSVLGFGAYKVYILVMQYYFSRKEGRIRLQDEDEEGN
ncbi:hypothetical protein HDU67_005253 [Dinochytrium kinnereticum]|nr:hypothetical protein HDU67_005253 [Dinochytrium kinnereticum]